MNIEAFSPSQIRACATMLQGLRGVDSKAYIIELANRLRSSDPKVIRSISHYRLMVPAKSSRLTNEEFLYAVGWVSLRALRRLTQELQKRGVTEAALKRFIHDERQKWLNESPEGKREP